MIRWGHAKNVDPAHWHSSEVAVIVGSQDLGCDIVARLTLAPHSQRREMARTLRHDADLRGRWWHLASRFELHDYDQMVELSSTLARDAAGEGLRARLLEQAWQAIEDPEILVTEFTFEDLLSFGPTTRRLFSWSMGEYLLQRAEGFGRGHRQTQTSLYLALMVVDTLEIVGLLREDPRFANVVEDLTRRIIAACRALSVDSEALR